MFFKNLRGLSEKSRFVNRSILRVCEVKQNRLFDKSNAGNFIVGISTINTYCPPAFKFESTLCPAKNLRGVCLGRRL